MPTDKMTMVTMSGPLDMVDMALRQFVMDRDFHIENTVDAISPVLSISRFGSSNPYSDDLNLAVSLMKKLEIKPEFKDWKAADPERDAVSRWLKELEGKLTAAETARDEKLRVALDNDNIVSQLTYFEGVDEDLDDLLHMKYVKLRVGRIPSDKYETCLKEMESNKEVYYVSTGSHDDWVYGLYFVLPRVADKVDGQFTALGFERVRVAPELDSELTPQEAEQLHKNAAQKARDEAAEQEKLIDGLKENGEALLTYYCYLRYMSDTFDLRYFAGYRYDRFYIVGWVPEKDADGFVKEFEQNEGFACVVGGHDKRAAITPPVKLKTGFLSKVFSPFVEMYGMPSYGEIDPRSFMAITYTIIFGIMFGDVGQGVCLALVGLLMWKLKKMWIGRVLIFAGCASTVFGFVYGSLFGYEDIIPGFHVLEGGNTMKILLIAVALGVCLLLICMVMNIINGIRQRDVKKIFFSPNGLAGAVMYLSLAAGVALTALFGINVFSPLYIVFLIVLPLLLMFAAEPLTKLVTGQKDWLPKSIGMFIVEGFFELFETMLSYVSNTVSFLRVGAFAISHAGMMMVVFMLAKTASGGQNMVAVVLGNVIVMGIEGVLVCIQVMRLEFYEMFGRFYQGTGVSFSPKTIDYSTLPQKNAI